MCFYLQPRFRWFYLQPRFMYSHAYTFTHLLSLPGSQITFTGSGGTCRGEEVSWHIALVNEKGRGKDILQKEKKG